MRILYIQQHFATGRGEAGVRGYQLVKTLTERGHQVTVICGYNWRDSSLHSDTKGWVDTRDVEGFRVIQLMVKYSNHQGFARRIWSFLLFGLVACWQALKVPADLVFVSSTPLTVVLPAWAVRVFKRTPYVLEVRDLWPDLPIAMGILKNRLACWALYTFEKCAYRRAWKLVGLAPGIRDGIARKAGRDPRHIAMVPNGCDTANLRPMERQARKHVPVPDDTLLLGYAGTHGRANGLDAILDAAGVLKERGIQDVAFALIGDGREKARLVARAEREGLDNVHFLGLFNKSLYGEVLSELDVGIQSLQNVAEFYYGTSPNKFFDYLAVGRPILVNYPGWMSDLVRRYDCGVAVEPDDKHAFCEAVLELRDRRHELKEMGQRGRRLAEDHFSQQKILIELAKYLEDPAQRPAVVPDISALEVLSPVGAA